MSVETVTTKAYRAAVPAVAGHGAAKSRRYLTEGAAYLWLARTKGRRLVDHGNHPDDPPCACLVCHSYDPSSPEARVIQRYARKLRAHDQAKAPRESERDIRGLYYVQDARQYVGNCVLWERTGRHGYTCELAEAGLFTIEEARRMTEGAHGERVAWRASDVQRLAIGHVRAESLRQAARLPVKGSKPLRHVQSCNRHTDCARAARAADKSGRTIKHCHLPECGEDCCEPFRRRRAGVWAAQSRRLQREGSLVVDFRAMAAGGAR